MNKGVIARFLCVNPDCNYSEEKLEVKSTLNNSGGKLNFKVPSVCPKCKSPIELINFVSGSVTIEEDKLE